MAISTLFCCAYILGLLLSPVAWSPVWLLGMGGVAVLLRSRQWLFPNFWRYSPTVRWWAIATCISLVAIFHVHLTFPRPAVNDVSLFIPADQASIPAQVSGSIERRPRLNRRGSMQVWLRAKQVSVDAGKTQQSVSGLVYATLPRKVAKDLGIGQQVQLTGQLYRPAPATRPHGYDFAAALALEGSFSGLKGNTVQLQQPQPPWGGWMIRQRIVDSLEKGAGRRVGAFLGALILGREAVDVPYDIRDAFIQVGLAHALAASGFQVSLILSSILNLTQGLQTSSQILAGSAGLFSFWGLSGAEASIVRAILMGFASLIALGLKRQVRPEGALLVIATLMLIVSPHWIFDLGFDLSVLATLGLIVTVPPLMDLLDWLPPVIATLIAVPFAATLWTLPLQLHIFGIFPTYSLLTNILSAPLLSALTIGGFISGLAAFVWPGLGSLLAAILAWPTQFFIAGVIWMSQLPGHSLAVGSISLWQILGLYACIGLVWLSPWWQKQWRLAVLLGALLVLLPVWHLQNQRFLVTVLDRTRDPMMIIEQPQGTIVLNSGDRNTADQTLVPFLQQEGLNRIDLALDSTDQSRSRAGWQKVLEHMPITTLSPIIPAGAGQSSPTRLAPQRILPIAFDQVLTMGEVKLQLKRAQPLILEGQIGNQGWLLVQGSSAEDFLAWRSTTQLTPVQVLWWLGAAPTPALMEAIHPQVLILSGWQKDETAIAALDRLVPRIFWTERDGTIQWTGDRSAPRVRGFSVTVNPGENSVTPMS